MLDIGAGFDVRASVVDDAPEHLCLIKQGTFGSARKEVPVNRRNSSSAKALEVRAACHLCLHRTVISPRMPGI